MVEAALMHTKSRKLSVSTGVAVEMLRARGEGCLGPLAKIFNELLFGS